MRVSRVVPRWLIVAAGAAFLSTALLAQGAVQVNAPPPHDTTHGRGAVAVGTPPVGGRHVADSLHCVDGTVLVNRTGVNCDRHGGMNERPREVGASGSTPTGSVAVSQPPVGAHRSTPSNVVPCKDGTTDTRLPPGFAKIGGYCQGHGGESTRPVEVGVTQPTGAARGSVAVSSAPVGGSPGVTTKTTANSIPCKDGTMQPRTASAPCIGHGGPQTAPVHVGASSSAAAPMASTTMAAHAGIPAGSTAKCHDGTYTNTQHMSGACSGHGGVATWIVKNLPK